MDAILDVITLLSVITHLFLLAVIQFRPVPSRNRPGWVLFTLLWSLLALALRFLPENLLLQIPVQPGFIAILAMAVVITGYGRYVQRDVGGGNRPGLVLSSAWLLALVASYFLVTDLQVGQTDWLLRFIQTPDLPGAITLLGLGLNAAVIIGMAFYYFYKQPLPEAANRALFWVVNTSLLSIGILLFISDTDVFVVAGVLLVTGAMIGLTYAHISHRVLDIRSGLITTLRLGLLLALTAVVFFLGLLVADSLPPEGQRAVTLSVLAVMIALLYVIVRQLIVVLILPFFANVTSPARAARLYSLQVSRAVSLSELIDISTTTLSQVMKVRRGGMILVNDTERDPQRVEIIAMQEVDEDHVDEIKGFINKDGPIYERLAVRKTPLLQFDIDYDPRFSGMDPSEREFFETSRMSAYAPILVEDILIGILTAGSKLNDAPFTALDLELLATMADQTGVALRNSRAMADLKHLNQTMMALNEDLEEANSQFEKLDSVKTDFITIASHELRTPLAQIRGYTDILDALNEQGMLDQEQIGVMVGNVRKATERTEELIAAMLDMSQLDVNAMDLRFAQAAPESILRMAIEPLTEHVKQRKLTLSARGLRGLPAIHCDMQRLVQAFRNLLTNAIKFTPDGGRIDITAKLQSATNGTKEHILITIADTGVGIDKENLELIFEKFYRASDPSLHSTGAYKFMGAGPGLGLTIAKGVIESHGGKVWAESSGHNMETFPGTVFYVMLPLTPPDEARRVLIEDSTSETLRQPSS